MVLLMGSRARPRPRRRRPAPDEAAFDLGADQVRVDDDAAVQHEGDLLDADTVAVVGGDLGDLEAAAGDAAGAAFGQRGSPPGPFGRQFQCPESARVAGQ
jgi:hypothetical protein